MSLSKNTTYNLIGTLVPLGLAVVTVPAYLKLIGAERYGVLAIAWLILGYFGVFDLGLGRAVTQRIAAMRDESDESRATTFGTAVVANGIIGCVGALILWPIAYYVFASGVGMSHALRGEAVSIAPLLALALPVATASGMLGGALMGRERFREVNLITTNSTVLFQLLPLGTAWLFGPDLRVLLMSSVLARCIGLAMLWWECGRVFGRDAFRLFDAGQLKTLMHYGGWVSVTSLIGPLLLMSDRFLIGRSLGAVAVTVFTVPTQITSRLSPIAGALGRALFPRLAYADPEEVDRLTSDCVRVLFAFMTLPVAIGVGIMEPTMRLWLGAQIGEQAAPIGRILLVAAWINVFAQVPYWRLQARGMPRAVALAHTIEIPFYIPLLMVLLARLGLLGAAIAGLARMLADLALLQWMAERRAVNLGGFAAGLAIFASQELALRVLSPSIPHACLVALGGGLCATAVSWLVLPRSIRRLVGPLLAKTKSSVLALGVRAA